MDARALKTCFQRSKFLRWTVQNSGVFGACLEVTFHRSMPAFRAVKIEIASLRVPQHYNLLFYWYFHGVLYGVFWRHVFNVVENILNETIKQFYLGIWFNLKIFAPVDWNIHTNINKNWKKLFCSYYFWNNFNNKNFKVVLGLNQLKK